ncbi:hypothetical protein OYC64_013556 [Pagothenia borchgrevinki]|uniref:DUF7869 domain-containing protein n=1 Tax=Pagothenia borchgrevinki TaxID=8213 RepID=A0ABD2FU38_PAGBO
MDSREEKIARLLNSNIVRGTASDEQWVQLITDYFLTAPVEVAPLSGSDSESDTDSSPQTTGAEEDEDTTEERPLLNDPVAEILQSVRHYVSEDSAQEIERARDYRCSCKCNDGVPCYTRYTPEEMVKRRDQMNEMTNGEKHLVLLGKISSNINLSKETACAKRGHQKERKQQRTSYILDGHKICRETFKFLHGISQDKLTGIIKFYKEHGLAPRMRRGGRVVTKRMLSFEDIQRIVRFITNFADVFAMPLPGRIPGFKRTDISVLPTTETKSSVWRKYKVQMQEKGHRAAGNSTFRKLWKELTPSVIIGRPMTDLCWFCQKNNIAIYRSSNLPDCVKSAKLRKQEEHLRIVGVERQAYQEMVASCKETARELGVKLGPNQPCSRDITIYYSFDYAQQVHYPSDPLQPGPIYFMVPRKCGLFGVCCEGVPQQVNYLIDEAHCSSKGSNAVIAYLHHFFSQYGLGEKNVHLHCDNCSGQNKNRYLLWYLAWRCMVGLHQDITLNFLIAGHTKFAPDWCFGLFKQQFRRTPVSCLKDISQAVRSSTVTGVNIPQLVGNESGETFVKTNDWHNFLAPSFRPLPGIKRYHHLRFTSAEPGVVYAKEFEGKEEESFMLLRTGCFTDQEARPTELTPPGLDEKRQWYLIYSENHP